MKKIHQYENGNRRFLAIVAQQGRWILPELPKRALFSPVHKNGLKIERIKIRLHSQAIFLLLDTLVSQKTIKQKQKRRTKKIKSWADKSIL